MFFARDAANIAALADPARTVRGGIDRANRGHDHVIDVI